MRRWMDHALTALTFAVEFVALCGVFAACLGLWIASPA